MASCVLLGAKLSQNYISWFSTVTLSVLLSPTVILRCILLRGLKACTVVHCIVNVNGVYVTHMFSVHM